MQPELALELPEGKDRKNGDEALPVSL